MRFSSALARKGPSTRPCAWYVGVVGSACWAFRRRTWWKNFHSLTWWPMKSPCMAQKLIPMFPNASSRSFRAANSYSKTSSPTVFPLEEFGTALDTFVGRKGSVIRCDRTQRPRGLRFEFQTDIEPRGALPPLFGVAQEKGAGGHRVNCGDRRGWPWRRGRRE